MLIYYAFFAILFIHAIIVFSCLCAASKKELPPNEINSIESFMLAAYPKFPALIFAKIFPGTFVGFGILGTFLGFARGIHEIPIDKTSDEILKGISTLLSGMNTAFYTSIFGVILSVIFSILFQFPIHKIKSQVSRMKSTQMESAKIDTSMQDYVNQVRELTSNLVLAKDSMETLPGKFKEVGSALEKSISPIKETFTQMQGTLQNYAEQAKLMENASSEIGETLKNFSAANEEITQNISEIFEKSETMNKSIIEENQTLTKAHKQTLEDYKLLDENISSALEKLIINVAEYSKTMENTLVETLENFTKAAEKVSNSFLGMEE